MSNQKKTAAIGGRISPDLRARLDAIGERYGVSDAVMLADALTALADLVEIRKGYERPVRMIPARDYHQFEGIFHLNEASRAKDTIDRARKIFDQLRDSSPPEGKTRRT